MTMWTRDELERIGNAEELDLASVRRERRLRPRPLTPSRGATVVLVALALSAAGCTTGSAGTDGASATSTTAGPGASANVDRRPQEEPMTNSDTQADRDAIIANFQARQRAMIDGDTERLRQLSTPDAHAGHITGYEQPQEEWLDQIQSGYFDYHTIDNHSIQVTVTGPNSATLVARSTIDVTIGGARNTWRLESTADYVKRDGRWLSGDGSSRTF